MSGCHDRTARRHRFEGPNVAGSFRSVGVRRGWSAVKGENRPDPVIGRSWKRPSKPTTADTEAAATPRQRRRQPDLISVLVQVRRLLLGKDFVESRDGVLVVGGNNGRSFGMLVSATKRVWLPGISSCRRRSPCVAGTAAPGSSTSGVSPGNWAWPSCSRQTES
jgi:hypothetical protein